MNLGEKLPYEILPVDLNRLSASKEIIENDNSWVVISLSKVGETEFEFLQTLQPTDEVESSYCHYVEMLKLLKNKRNDLYIFSRVVTYESCLTAKFQEDPTEPLREIAWRSLYGI